MKRSVFCLLLVCCLALTGCGKLLEREYTAVAPHSSTYYESGSRDVLRAENYQDLVNDLMLLVSAHDASGTIWLYPSEDIADAGAAAQQACREVQEETPLGAYALSYLTYTVDDSSRNYARISVTAGYRRTAEQLKSVVHATNVAALKDLLTAVAENGGTELVVQVNSFDGGRQAVQDTVAAVQQSLPQYARQPAWQVSFYPDSDAMGIIEILLKS